MGKLNNGLIKLLTYIAGGITIITFIVAIFNPLTRFSAIGGYFTWSQTLATWLVIILAMFASGLLYLTGGHVAIELLSAKVRGLPGKVLRIFNTLIGVAFAIFLLAGAIARTSSFLLKETATPFGPVNIPLWIVFLAFSISLFMFALCSFIQLINVAREPPPQIK